MFFETLFSSTKIKKKDFSAYKRRSTSWLKRSDVPYHNYLQSTRRLATANRLRVSIIVPQLFFAREGVMADPVKIFL